MAPEHPLDITPAGRAALGGHFYFGEHGGISIGSTVAMRPGVPKEALFATVLGYFNFNTGNLIGYVEAQFSDGTKLPVERTKAQIFQPDWMKAFEPENVGARVKVITPDRPGALIDPRSA